MSLTLEKDIEKYLTTQVKKSSGLSYKWLSTITGVPDRIVILNQKILFVELKTATGRLSPRQTVVFDELGEQGHPVHVLYSKEDVDDFIKYATENTITSVPATYYKAVSYGPQSWSVPPTGLGQDDDIIDDTGGAV